MPRISPASPHSLGEAQRRLVAKAEQVMGFAANDVLLLARVPGLLEAMMELTMPVLYEPGSLGAPLKHMVAYMASTAAGCSYCGSHTLLSSLEQGIPREKLNKIWEYAEDPIFTPAESAALRVAHLAALTPNATTDAHFGELRKHFDEPAILEIVAVISLFGFLNRWNDTLKTDIESVPRAASLATG